MSVVVSQLQTPPRHLFWLIVQALCAILDSCNTEFSPFPDISFRYLYNCLKLTGFLSGEFFIVVCLFVLLFFNLKSLMSPAWSKTDHVDQPGPRLAAVLLPPSPES